MNRVLLLFLLLFSFAGNVLFSQTCIGYKFDLNGQPFYRNFDPINYDPNKKFSIIHNSDSYEVGYYYDITGSKVDGYIKFENKKIWFKTEKEEFREVLKPDEINSLVIGIDSFFVVSNFYYHKKIRKNPEFIQFITTFNNLSFAKYYHFSSDLAQQYASADPIIEVYMVKAKDSSTWEDFSSKDKDFKDIALEYFGYIPYLKTKIINEEYTGEDLLTLIKMSEYQHKYENNDFIYFDPYWQEVRDPNKAKFYATIKSIKDSVWTL